MQQLILTQSQLTLRVSVVTLECCLTTNYYYQIMTETEYIMQHQYFNEALT